MKAIAWDDNPAEYMEMLKECFEDYSIDLTIERDPEKFTSLFIRQQDELGFVVLDYLNLEPKINGKKVAGKQVATGAELARDIANRNPKIPIFMITGHIERAAVNVEALPPKVYLKSKNTSSPWMAADIVEILQHNGLYCNDRRVFLVYGHDKSCKDATKKVHDYLKNDLGLEVVKVGPTNLEKALADGLVERMRDCRAVVAICTPDDEWTTGVYYPRQNVILEIGIAMGLGGGVEKLCVLRRKGGEKQNTAELPSDLGGVLSIPFGENVEDCFAEMKEKLLNIGVKI